MKFGCLYRHSLHMAALNQMEETIRKRLLKGGIKKPGRDYNLNASLFIKGACNPTFINQRQFIYELSLS